MPLRIMAIGASTTRGDESFDNNGFRRPIREHLVAIGNPVNYVGTQRVGNMSDNEIEAYPGARLDMMHHHAEQVVPRTKPNIFLVNLGANDCFQHWDIPNFYKRYYSFVDYLLKASPRATIIMGTLLPSTETERFNGAEDIAEVNRQMHRLHKIFQAEGKPVVMADMTGPDGIQTTDLASDGMHPVSSAYIRMGQIMLRAIFEANARGFLRPAEPVHGILQDGGLENQDETYGRWMEAQKMLEYKRKKAEEDEVNKMKAELKLWIAQEKQNRAEVPKNLRQHAEHVSSDSDSE
jgi:lysophospholipase L1-like esterase